MLCSSLSIDCRMHDTIHVCRNGAAGRRSNFLPVVCHISMQHVPHNARPWSDSDNLGLCRLLKARREVQSLPIF